MLQKIFRSFAGVSVVLYIWLMFKCPFSLSDKIILSVFGAVFAVYAILGRAPFDKLFAAMNNNNLNNSNKEDSSQQQ